MNTSLKRRLDRIEQALPKATEAPCEAVVPIIKGWLAGWGVIQGPAESLAETTVRAMGISCGELRRLLAARTAGWR